MRAQSGTFFYLSRGFTRWRGPLKPTMVGSVRAFWMVAGIPGWLLFPRGWLLVLMVAGTSYYHVPTVSTKILHGERTERATPCKRTYTWPPRKVCRQLNTQNNIKSTRNTFEAAGQPWTSFVLP